MSLAVIASEDNLFMSHNGFDFQQIKIAAEEAKKNPQSVYDALASENVSAEAWEKYYSPDPTLSNLSPEITDEIIEYYKDEAQWMLDNGIITNPVDVDTFVDASYYEKAKSSGFLAAYQELIFIYCDQIYGLCDNVKAKMLFVFTALLVRKPLTLLRLLIILTKMMLWNTQ